MPTQQKGTITDKTLEAFIKDTKTPKQTYHLPEGSFNGAILNSLNPHFFPTQTQAGLYNKFNDQTIDTINAMLDVTENPIAISTHLMNGAYDKLTNSKSPDHLTYTKAKYEIHKQHSNKVLSLRETTEGEDYNVIIINPQHH